MGVSRFARTHPRRSRGVYSSVIGVPSLARCGRPVRSWNSWSGRTPSRCRTVAVKSAGETGCSVGTAPVRSVAPWTVPPLDACPGHENRLRLRPVVPSGLAVDPGRTAEFAQAHEQRVFQQSSLGQLPQQAGDAAVGRRRQAVFQVRDVVGVRVPDGGVLRALVVPVNGDQTHVGLQQPSRQETALAEEVRPVGRADRGGLAVDVKGPLRRGRAEKIEGPILELTEFAGTAVEPPGRVQRAQQPLSVVESTRGHVVWQRDQRSTKGSPADIGFNEQRIIRPPQEPAAEARVFVHDVVADDLRQRDKRRHRAAETTELRHQRPEVRIIVGGRPDERRRGGVRLRMVPPRQHGVPGRGMRRIAVRDRSHDAHLVGLLGRFGKEFAELNSGDTRRNLAQFPANLDRSLRLRVPGLRLRRAAGQEQDHTPLRPRPTGDRFRSTECA